MSPSAKNASRTAAIASATLFALSALAGLPRPVAAVNSACPTADSSTATTCTWTTAGHEYQYFTPVGVTSLHVVAIGSSGLAGQSSSGVVSSGGAGAQVTADIPAILPVYFVYVDGSAGGSGGFEISSGVAGTGGTGPVIATCALTLAPCLATVGTALDPRQVVSAGGGGAGVGVNGGGIGGSATPTLCPGGDGANGPGPGGGVKGRGGGCAGGGAGGTGGVGSSPGSSGGAGAPGAAGVGGKGGAEAVDGHPFHGGAGGGGGGGYYGGGGGGAGCGDTTPCALFGSSGGAGGGGGTSFVTPVATSASAITAPLDSTLSLVISWGPGAPVSIPETPIAPLLALIGAGVGLQGMRLRRRETPSQN